MPDDADADVSAWRFKAIPSGRLPPAQAFSLSGGVFTGFLVKKKLDAFNNVGGSGEVGMQMKEGRKMRVRRNMENMQTTK